MEPLFSQDRQMACGRLTFNRPDSATAMSSQMLAMFHEKLQELMPAPRSAASSSMRRGNFVGGRRRVQAWAS